MAAPTAPVLGINGKLYRNTGSYGSPVWDLIPNCMDLELKHDWTDVEVTVRSGGGAKQHEPGLIDFGFTLKMLYDPADTDMTTLIAAAAARTGIEFLALDQAVGTAGSFGTRAFCKIFNYTKSENADGIMMASFDIKNAYSTNTAATYTAS